MNEDVLLEPNFGTYGDSTYDDEYAAEHGVSDHFDDLLADTEPRARVIKEHHPDGIRTRVQHDLFPETSADADPQVSLKAKASGQYDREHSNAPDSNVPEAKSPGVQSADHGAAYGAEQGIGQGNEKRIEQRIDSAPEMTSVHASETSSFQDAPQIAHDESHDASSGTANNNPATSGDDTYADLGSAERASASELNVNNRNASDEPSGLSAGESVGKPRKVNVAQSARNAKETLRQKVRSAAAHVRSDKQQDKQQDKQEAFRQQDGATARRVRDAGARGGVASSSTEDRRFNSDFKELIIINVLAKKDQFFYGNDLLRILLSCGLRYGEHKIFHRYEQHSGKGPLQFSLANIVEPGVFDIDHMDNFQTPGLCLFMSLPGPRRSAAAFDLMVDIARKLSVQLDGEMRDENHSVMTQQTIEHSRQRVLDFERRLLSQRRYDTSPSKKS